MTLLAACGLLFFLSPELFVRKAARDTRLFSLAAFVVIASWALITLTGLPDVGVYKRIFDAFQQTGRGTSYFEPGYLAISRLSARAGFDFWTFRYCSTIAFSLLFARGIFKYSPNISLSLLYFFTTLFVVSFLIQVRTGLGLSVFIGIGIPCYIKKKKAAFALSIAAASLFHLSLLALFSPWVLAQFLKTRRMKLLAVALPFAIVFLHIDNLILRQVESLASIAMLGKITHYVNSNVLQDVGVSNRDYLAALLLVLLAGRTGDRLSNFMFASYYCALFFHVLFRNFYEIGFRLYIIFQYALVFLMPLLYPKKNIVARALNIAFCFVNYYMLISNYGSGSIIAEGK